MKEPEYAPLIKYVRNGLTEQIHSGLVIRMNKEKVLSKIGSDNGYKFYHRSCMKPMQASALIDIGADRKYNLTDEELAVCCASHTGELIHRKLILSILNKGGYNIDDLLLTPSEPLSVEEKIRCIKNNIPFDKIHHNCSGKHSAMLLVCKEMNFDTSNYKDFSNPLTNFILEKVAKLCETDLSKCKISKDGCGLPVLATTLEELGRGFLNLFTDKKYQRLKNAFACNPYVSGGKNRLDSEIMNADETNTVVAKVGACGLCCIVDTVNEECIVIKIADSDMKARSYAALQALKSFKHPNKLMLERLNKVYSREIHTVDNDLIGEIVPCFDLN